MFARHHVATAPRRKPGCDERRIRGDEARPATTSCGLANTGRRRFFPAIVTSMTLASPTHPRPVPRMLGWRRIRFPLGACLFLSLLFLPDWHGSLAVLYGRLFFTVLVGVLAFGLFERWPA